MAGPFHHGLHIGGAAAAHEFAEHVELGELRFVARIREAAGAHAVADDSVTS